MWSFIDMNMIICAYIKCGKFFEPKTKTAKYCSKNCAIAFRNTTFSYKDSLKKKYGDDWEVHYSAWKQKLSDVTSGEKNPMYGRHDHTTGLKTYALQITGKSLEEIHGKEKADDIKERVSIALRGSNNPAYGKSYQSGGKSVKGYYKGKYFRSLFEYSFMKHLEKIGCSLDADVEYENFLIKYEFNNSERTYRPDFYDKLHNVVYEVKPYYAINRATNINKAKWSAAKEYFALLGIEFTIVSELDFQKITFDDALKDQSVFWKEETFEYFKRKKNDQKQTNNRGI